MPAAACARVRVRAHGEREGGSYCHGNADKYKYIDARWLCRAPESALSNSSTSKHTRGGEVPVTVTSLGPCDGDIPQSPAMVTSLSPLPGLDAHVPSSPLLLTIGPGWGGGCWRTPALGRQWDLASSAAPGSGRGHQHPGTALPPRPSLLFFPHAHPLTLLQSSSPLCVICCHQLGLMSPSRVLKVSHEVGARGWGSSRQDSPSGFPPLYPCKIMGKENKSRGLIFRSRRWGGSSTLKPMLPRSPSTFPLPHWTGDTSSREEAAEEITGPRRWKDPDTKGVNGPVC